ncbi:hypothetical protein Aduo_009139 [Ancylostoma duodenale]
MLSKVKKILKKKPSDETVRKRKQPPRAAKKPVDYGATNTSVTARGSTKSLTSSVMLTLCMIVMIFNNTASATVLSCSKLGVNASVATPSQLCINYKDCGMVPPEAGPTEVALPFKYRIAEHQVQWRTIINTVQHMETIICPPVDICSMITCTFCAEFFGNPQCAPELVTLIAALFLYIIISLTWLLCYIGFRAKLLLGPCRSNGMQEDEQVQQLERIELKGPVQICVRSHPMQSRIITFTAFQLASTCQYTHTLTSNNTLCTKRDGILNCRYIMENRIMLSENHPHA